MVVNKYQIAYVYCVSKSLPDKSLKPPTASPRTLLVILKIDIPSDSDKFCVCVWSIVSLTLQFFEKREDDGAKQTTIFPRFYL